MDRAYVQKQNVITQVSTQNMYRKKEKMGDGVEKYTYLGVGPT